MFKDIMKHIDLSTELRKRIETRTALHTCVILLILLTLLILKYFWPAFHVNEGGKLISVRQLVEPGFLSQDWVVAKGHGDNIFDFAFSAVMAPLWLCLHNMLLVAMVARVLFWSAFLLILVKLEKRLQLGPYVLLIGTAGWLMLRQCLGTSEWILGGIEPKCFSYALLLLALIAVFDKSMVKAGIFCGLAISFHFLVGLWGGVAIGIAVLAAWREFGWRKISTFALVPTLINLPLAMIALKYDAVSTDANRAISSQLAVEFADPLHLDPDYFHGILLFAALVVMTAASVWLYGKILPKFEARMMSGFLIVLTLEFGLGLIAWELHSYRFLLSFPFRVADVLVLLFFLLALTCWAWRQVLAWMDGERWKRLPLGWKNGAFLMAAMLLVGTSAYLLNKPVRNFALQWQNRQDKENVEWAEMTEWIRAQTPKDAVFVSPPWMNIFWVDAERAQVGDYKRAPHNYQIIEWKHRLEALNGGPLTARGIHIMDELKRHYPYLSVQELEKIRDLYGASYYLTTVERPEMSGQLVHGNGEYFLYRLDGLGR